MTRRSILIGGIVFVVAVAAVCTLTLTDLGFQLKVRIGSVYFAHKYPSELEMVKGYFKVISLPDRNAAKQILYDDFYFRHNPSLLDWLWAVLQEKSIETLKAANIVKHPESQEIHMIVYLGNNFGNNVIVILKQLNGKWLIARMSLSGKLEHQAEALYEKYRGNRR